MGEDESARDVLERIKRALSEAGHLPALMKEIADLERRVEEIERYREERRDFYARLRLMRARWRT